jgi:pectin methylesterase-like acyl-CoA thioesterase
MAICSVLLALVGTETGATLYVSKDGSGDYTRIQDAINAAVWDQIEVAPGTYNEAINFHGKAIRVYSKSGNPADTIINGTGDYHVVQCINGEGPSTILEGFKITGGNAVGGPVFPLSPDRHRGGGMYNKGSSPTVIHCVFESNTAVSGGGMYNYDSSPRLTNCTFSKNTATGELPQGG